MKLTAEVMKRLKIGESVYGIESLTKRQCSGSRATMYASRYGMKVTTLTAYLLTPEPTLTLTKGVIVTRVS